METLTPEQALARIREHIEVAGSMRAYARKHGLSVSNVSETLSGKREPSQTILDTVGLARATTYTQVKPHGEK